VPGANCSEAIHEREIMGEPRFVELGVAMPPIICREFGGEVGHRFYLFAARGMGVIVYSPMASGLLTGAMTRRARRQTPCR